MFLVDTAAGRIVDDAEVKAELAAEHPYAEWLAENLVSIKDLPPRQMLVPTHGVLVRQQRLFGFTDEELRILVGPMAATGAEPTGSMGSDTPIAALSVQAAAAVRLLQPALRTGDEPATRRHPGGARHLAVGDGRSRAATCSSRRRARRARSLSSSRSSTTTTSPSCST